jgi:hypothetical protein
MFFDDDDESCEQVKVEDFEDYGTCCVCGCDSSPERPVQNIICLDFKQPIPGDGWGCAVCNLPLEGAVAVICDRCLEEQNFDFKFIVSGLVSEKKRIPYPENKIPFKHDESKHQQLESMTVGTTTYPSWDYDDVLGKLSVVFRDLSRLQSFILDQEQSTLDADLDIYQVLRRSSEKLMEIAELLDGSKKEADEF